MSTMPLTHAWAFLVIDTACKGLLILWAAWLVTVLCRRSSAATRHSLWLVSMVMLFLLPILSASLPAWQMPIMPQPLVHSSGPIPDGATSDGRLSWKRTTAPETAAMGVPAPPTEGSAPASQHAASPKQPERPDIAPARTKSIPHWSVWVVFIWALGTVLALLPVWRSVGHWRRLIGLAEVVRDDHWIALLNELSARFGVPGRIRLMHAADAVVPIVWQVLPRRATVLLPSNSDDWSHARRRLVLMHELAHLKRHDCIWHLVARMIVALHWFNPMAWVALRRLLTESEAACDDVVLSNGHRPSEYAEHLLAIAKAARASSFLAVAGASMARHDRLEQRLLAILDASRRRGAITRGRIVLTAMILTLAVVPIAMLHAAAKDTATAEPSLHRARAIVRGKRIPFPLRDREIRIDGDLTDWGDLRDQSIAIHQIFNYGWGPKQSGEPDAAIVKLMRDEDAIYLGARVVDKSVTNPFPIGDTWRADGVEFYFDVRPLSVVRSTPGHYDAGVCQIAVMPPMKVGGAWRWHAALGPVVGPVEATGQLIVGGYEVEMRVPMASLIKDPPRNRLSQPIGFQVMINDSDVGRDGSRPGQRSYAWSRYGDFNKHTRNFACADPQFRFTMKTPVMLCQPAQALSDRDRLRFESALVTRIGTIAAAQHHRLKYRFASSEFDVLVGTDLPREPDIETVAAQTDRYPSLGIEFHRQILTVNELAPGRYYVETYLSGPDPVSVVPYYGQVHEDEVQLNRAFVLPDDPDPLTYLASDGEVTINMDTHYPTAGQDVAGTVHVDLDGRAWFALSESAARAAESGALKPALAVRLTVQTQGRGEAKWQAGVPVKPWGTRFTIPGSDLGRGAYELSVQAVGANARSLDFRRGRTNVRGHPFIYDPAVPLVVMPARSTVLETNVTDAAPLLNKVVRVADPLRTKYPNDSASDCYARSVHDLQTFAGRVHVAYGDSWHDRGPIDILSFASNERGQVVFTKEGEFAQETVRRLRVYGDALYVGGGQPREPWWGTIYVKRSVSGVSRWDSVRTIHSGYHVDVCAIGERLYTTGSQPPRGPGFWESNDAGVTWRRVDRPDQPKWGFRELARFGDDLLITSSRAKLGAYRFTDGRLERLLVPLVPEFETSTSSWVSLHRLTPFANGLVYSASSDVRTRPLFFLKDATRGAVLVELFRDRQVRDIVARGDTCYVLTAEEASEAGGQFKTELYSSDDLRSWKRLALFEAPATPTAFEILDGVFYVALGDDDPWEPAYPDSGSIWRLH